LEFGILSLVHCLLIPELRKNCFEWMANKYENLCHQHIN
jgi:hypothetical protein